MTTNNVTLLTEELSQFRSAISVMHNASTRRAQILESLSVLSKSLARDIKNSISFVPNTGGKEEDTNIGFHLSALEKLFQLQQEQKEGGDGNKEIQEFFHHLNSTDVLTSEQSDNNLSNTKHEYIFKNTYKKNEDKINNFMELLSITNETQSENKKISEMISHRDALREEIKLLKRDNEHAALCREYLKCGIRQIACASKVAIMEKDVFVALHELFTKLLDFNEDWLIFLDKATKNPSTNNTTNTISSSMPDNIGPIEGEEKELLEEINRIKLMRHELVLARQSTERREQSARISSASLIFQLQQQQSAADQRSNSRRELKSTLHYLEVNALEAESKQASLKLQYAERCLSPIPPDEIETITCTNNNNNNNICRYGVDSDRLARCLSRYMPGPERMSILLALLKSVVVNYETDLPALRHLRRLRPTPAAVGAFTRGERVFREMHRCMRGVLTAAGAAAGVGVAPPSPSPSLLNSQRLPSHQLEPCHHSLLTLVVQWGRFTAAEQHSFCSAAGDLLPSVYLLLAIAQHVEGRRCRRRLRARSSSRD